MSRELPLLPEALGYVNLRSAQGLGPDDTAALAKTSGGYRTTPVYTADQLRAFAEEAVRLEREACMRAVQHEALYSGDDERSAYNAALFAAERAIRARSQEES